MKTNLLTGWACLFTGMIACLFAAGLSAQTLPVPGITLPEGKTIHITYKVRVNDPFTSDACQISNQSTVSGNNFTTVATDDPDSPGSNDPTVTPVLRAPDVTCPANVTVNADAGVCTSTQSFAAMAGGCPSPALSYSIGMAGIGFPYVFPLGTTTVSASASNGQSPDAGCSFTVTVVDNQGPTIACPANQTVNADAACSGTVGTWSAVSVSDNCTAAGSITVAQSPAASATLSGHNDSETVTLTASDGNGNTGSCSFMVTLKDVTAPVITCPADQTVSADAGCTGTVGAWSAASVSDNCTAAPVVTQSPASSTALSGHNDSETVTLTADDGNGNTAGCTFTVTLKDVTPPTARCNNASIQIQPNDQGTLTADDIDNGSSDNCGIQGTTASQTTFTCANLGTNIVVLTATDINGLTGTCTATVTVSDPNHYCCALPSAICKPATAPLNSSGTVTITPASVNNGSTYECGLASISVSPNTFTCSNLGANIVTLTVTDINGNSSTCTATVTVTTGAFDNDGDGICNNVDNCPNTANPGQTDSDCDGVGDACDVCPGGDDSVDNNHDGLPDCKYPPAYADIIPAWKCGNNKVYICHKPLNQANTNCVSYSALGGHIGHGDFLGPCGNASCSNFSGGNTASRAISGSVALLPNPASQEVWVDLSSLQGKPVVLRLLDLRGAVIQKTNISGDRSELVRLGLEQLSNGMYFVQVQAEGEPVQTVKLVVENNN